MAGSTDLIGAFRAYAQKALGNDFNPEKAAIALNNWVKDSGDALKERIERETERAVKKLGLAKESDLRKVMDELAHLRKELGITSRSSSTTKKAKKTRSANSANSANSVLTKKSKKKPSSKKQVKATSKSVSAKRAKKGSRAQ